MSANDEIECVVVGAGVVGLACAAAIARSGKQVIVLEKESAIGTHTSSRNSEVIHAGIYYPPGSLKAELCRVGKAMLYEFARDRGVPHSQVGKLVVAASESQVAALRGIIETASKNGVDDLRLLAKGEAKELEPEVSCEAAVYSPSTGIIDSHALMLALEGELEAHGGMVVLQTELESARFDNGKVTLRTAGLDGTTLTCRHLVNCGGLFASRVARSISGVDRNRIPKEHFAIGHYYRLSGRSPCSHLIYPVPEPGGLGVHLTLDLGGQAKFGPDVRWIDDIDYTFDDSRFDDFQAAIRSYLPALDVAKLAPDYTGIRPKIVSPGKPDADFRIDINRHDDAGSVMNLYGIESPGLTASMAIGAYVERAFSAPD